MSGGGAGRFTVFLDRDGVFNVHPRIGVRKWGDFHWLPGVKEAFARLNRADVQTALCTNQPQVSVGLVRRRTIEAIHRRMQEELAEAGGRLDHIEAAYLSTPLPSRRRKPGPGMLESAARHFAAQGHPVEKARAVMVGDKPKDAQAGNAFGVHALLLATTYDEATLRAVVEEEGLDATIVADLAAAVGWVLDRLEKD